MFMEVALNVVRKPADPAIEIYRSYNYAGQTPSPCSRDFTAARDSPIAEAMRSANNPRGDAKKTRSYVKTTFIPDPNSPIRSTNRLGGLRESFHFSC
jgi:hypothetical protein